MFVAYSINIIFIMQYWQLLSFLKPLICDDRLTSSVCTLESDFPVTSGHLLTPSFYILIPYDGKDSFWGCEF